MDIYNWLPLQKANEITESRLIRAILDGTFPINSSLPGERELAELLGVTRPTLREVMQRMERDGWLEIHHGKSTRVRDYWKEGGFGVSIALAKYTDPLPVDYAANLLEVRILLCPTYTRQAVEKDAEEIAKFLAGSATLDQTAEAFATFDWELHWHLTISSGNLFFTHFINSVKDLYSLLGQRYYSHDRTRRHSADFYQRLKSIAEDSDAEAAESFSGKVMRESLALWKEINEQREKN